MVNDTTGEGNVTCSTCGKPCWRNILIINLLILIWPFCTHTAELNDATSFLVITSAVIVKLFALIRLFMEVLQFGYDPKSYISDWTNLPEVSLYVLSIIFAWTSRMCPEKWQWQIGVMAVLLGWIYLIRFCAKFPSTGIYIIMFGKIFITFLNVIILSVLLLTTFAITFHMTFSETQFQVSHSWIAVFKIFLWFVQKPTEKPPHQQQPLMLLFLTCCALYYVNVVQCIFLFSIAIAILLSSKYYAEDHINDSGRL